MIGILITLLFSASAIIRPLPIERLETLLYDVRYQVRGRTMPPKEVAIVAIDDKSLAALGRWYLDRARVASVIDTLKDLGAKVIVSDIIWSEPAKDDDILAVSIKRAGNVILPVVFDFEGEEKKTDDPMLADYAFPMVRNMDDLKIFPPISAKGASLPRKELISGAESLAYINMFPDRDGVLRWEALAVEYRGEIYPSMDLQAARAFLGLPVEGMILNAARGVQLGDRFIETDFWNRALIHYYGPKGTFPYVSALDVIEGRADPSRIKDKVVLLGATAVGLYDLRVTPTSAAMPGIEKHASVIASIIHNRHIHRPANWVNVLIVLISGILFSFIIVRMKAVYGAILSAAFISAGFIGAYYVFFSKGIWLTVAYPGNSILVTYFVVTAYRYATEERYAKRIRGMFSSYVTEKVVNELIKNPNLAKLGGERREITVFFSDVRGFTTFSEQHSPEQVVAILNEYLGEMSHIIFHWDGTLDKFVGDEIVAFWGAPVPQEKHAILAIKCTLHMIKRLAELSERWIAEERAPLAAGFGLNTGEVIVGNIGADGKKMDYTVIGDNVNLGARVEGLTRKYNADMLITASTLDKIREAISDGTIYRVKITGLDLVAVKGKAEPVAIYSVESLPQGESSVITEVDATEVRRMTEK